MPPIAQVAGAIALAPKPVLCLDTCDILEVVQCLAQGRGVGCIAAARNLIDTLVANPSRVQPVITFLVEREWQQNITAVRTAAEQYIRDYDARSDRLDKAATGAGLSAGVSSPIAGGSLVGTLAALSQSLLDCGIRLDQDADAMQAALRRVYDKIRPSHGGYVKDSIHLEHYLELTRQLRARGFAGDCYFVSRNRADYWAPSGPRLHPDLQPEFDDPAVRLQFCCTLEEALGLLGI